ncbi:MAG TPA: DoxX family protein [Candidatus Sulfotelmatobacter sp.]|jgi:putative oxidoreductase|nr:DoxX family protein [Candidatus Sulfotelmatobacter sp.]
MKFLNSFQPLGLAILRVALALIFIYHGYPKLVRTDAMMREFFVQHGFPSYFVGLAGILECIGGGMLLIGLFTRPAALLLAGEMAIAIWKVKMVHGVFAVNEYQFELTLAAACVALATLGAGTLSVDHVMLGDGAPKRKSA